MKTHPRLGASLWIPISFLLPAIGLASDPRAAKPAHDTVARPPQFVMLAFDNCSEITRWEELKAFTHEMNSTSRPLHFTFFLSGVNFLPSSRRAEYQGPGHHVGYSNIGFGGSTKDVHTRLQLIHELYEEGNELASHTVGHFDGATWTTDEWRGELERFTQLSTEAFHAEGFADADKMLASMKGFRAPYLSTSPGMYEALEQLKYRYDTSGDSEPEHWPGRKSGMWYFPLADLRIVPTGVKTLSMDYNFYASQSKAEPDPIHQEEFKQEMIATYQKYFLENYLGNRAPVNVGHHFEGYQQGVYNEALKEFAAKICGLKEVRCATYSELADYMDSLSPQTRAEYQHGDFPHAARTDLPLDSWWR